MLSTPFEPGEVMRKFHSARDHNQTDSPTRRDYGECTCECQSICSYYTLLFLYVNSIYDLL